MAHLTDSSAVAARYSAAIFALAAEKKKESAVVQAFAALSEALRADSFLSESLANPVVTREAKAAALVACLKGADSIVVDAVRTIALKGRSDYIPVIAGALAALLAATHQELRADVISAQALTGPEQAALQEALAKATGKHIVLNISVDPTVLGGFSVQFGSQKIDGTLAGQLARLTQYLKQAA